MIETPLLADLRYRCCMIEIDMAVSRGAFDLNVTLATGPGVTGLFGRSGSGKTTVLAAVAGLLRPARGRIVIGGDVLFDAARGVFVPPHRRRVGLVFQDAQLFPHLSVRQNLVYGRWFAARGGLRLPFEAVVGILGIETLLERRPASLSGGERQRVAIGRALLAMPRLLLMDEPLAALDQARKREILPLIERVRDGFGVPILYVSHAAEEIARLATHVVALEAGKVVAAGPPALALAPRGSDPSQTRFDALSVLTGTVTGHDMAYAMTMLAHPAGAISLPGLHGVPGGPLRVVVRGADVALATSAPAGLSMRTALSGSVLAITRDAGPVAQVDVALVGGQTLSAFITRRAVDELGLIPGGAVTALVKTASIDE